MKSMEQMNMELDNAGSCSEEVSKPFTEEQIWIELEKLEAEGYLTRTWGEK